MASSSISNSATAEPLHVRTGPNFPLITLLLTLSALWFILCRHLSNEWAINEQYNYGWFVPFFAAYLFWLRWESRTRKVESRNEKVEKSRGPGSSKFLLYTFYFLLLAALLPLRAFEIGNPDWRPLGWLHAGIVIGLTLTIIWQAGGTAWLKHFAFPVAFIFVAVPWVSPIEEPIVQGLMRVVASIACEAINLLGIPAQLEGSVIRISSGVVGVNEACSGVRSLQTSIMIGLLFGELKRLSLVRRLGLLAGAIAIAFIANCARAFFLVWIAATRNVDAVAHWHDLAGYAILIAVFAGTMGLAAFLTKSEAKSQKSENEAPTSDLRPLTTDAPPFLLSTSNARPLHRIRYGYFLLPLPWVLATELVVELWYRSGERNLIATPTWSVRWPEQAPGFREIKIDENVKATLRYDSGRQATWPLSFPNNSEPITATPRASASMFFFRWEPGTTSILRARAHRPDICLPNTGWRVTEDRGIRRYPTGDGTEMPFRHFAFARPAAENRSASAHAFFCQREDRVPRAEAQRFDLTAGATSDWSRSDRLRVVREGFRNQGQQVLEVVLLSPRPIDGGVAETEFAKLVPQIVR